MIHETSVVPSIFPPCWTPVKKLHDPGGPVQQPSIGSYKAHCLAHEPGCTPGHQPILQSVDRVRIAGKKIDRHLLFPFSPALRLAPTRRPSGQAASPCHLVHPLLISSPCLEPKRYQVTPTPQLQLTIRFLVC